METFKPVKCRIEWAITDGSRTVYLEKFFFFPCWIRKGQVLEIDGFSSHRNMTVETEPVLNVNDCSQDVFVSWESDTPRELDLMVSQLCTRSGWRVESEDKNG